MLPLPRAGEGWGEGTRKSGEPKYSRRWRQPTPVRALLRAGALPAARANGTQAGRGSQPQSNTRQNTAFKYRDSGTCASHG
ncbi:hypothetical protein [Lysobacter gummosus]|uniref:hypothetical protein n=1 Tax=Lysobacter gummosus TaxID=262324 RepID=UPI003625CA2B